MVNAVDFLGTVAQCYDCGALREEENSLLAQMAAAVKLDEAKKNLV
jgi:hypothetical protein